LIKRIVISGGGTGGHIFPAIAIADELRRRNPLARIFFVGAEGKMEMEKVPEAGYPIVGLPIRGIQRSVTLANVVKNLAVPFRLAKSLRQAMHLLHKEQPDAVVGVGGYASGPTLLAARWLGIPYLIQEQNSYAGITNRWLARQAAAICTAYPGMERQLRGKNIVLTGNPVRAGYQPERLASLRAQALEHFGFVDNCPTVLITGGSLGARAINRAVDEGLEKLLAAGIQVVWQTGKAYAQLAAARAKDAEKMCISEKTCGKIWTHAFIHRMDLAYAVADVVVGRSGALTLSELCLAGKPAVLVPSPNVAEDHQTHNARALTDRGAALLVPDAQAGSALISTTLALLHNPALRKSMAACTGALAFPHATAHIADALEKIARPYSA